MCLKPDRPFEDIYKRRGLPLQIKLVTDNRNDGTPGISATETKAKRPITTVDNSLTTPNLHVETGVSSVGSPPMKQRYLDAKSRTMGPEITS